MTFWSPFLDPEIANCLFSAGFFGIFSKKHGVLEGKFTKTNSNQHGVSSQETPL